MKPFLRQVADHYYKNGDMGHMCFVFPNRRSMVFFRKHISDIVAGDVFAVPMMMPQMYTINDFFIKASGLQSTDRVRLLLKLYECYKELNPKAEPLDEFIFWGDVILGDFNDIDKYLIDPKQLFTNVADFKSLQDTYEYLSDTQRKAVEAFVRHFNDASGKLTVDIGSDNVKSRFLQIWNILHPLYERYSLVLEEAGIAYEGKIYRSLADRLVDNPVCDVLGKVFPPDTKYVFVGLNALNECEKTLLRKLRDAELAEFCWDWTGEMIRDPKNRSSYFMKDNVRDFPQASRWDEDETGVPEVNVISVSSAVGQAKRLPDILSSVKDFNDCAVVLPDENLLVPVLNSIPEYVTDINVTMGLPMSGSLIYSMMADISAIQLHCINRNGMWLFYHKQVWNLFSGEIFRAAADQQTMKIVDEIKASAGYYIPQEMLSGTLLLDMIFNPVLKTPKEASSQQIGAFASYQKNVIQTVAPALAADEALILELQYAKEYYRCISILQEMDLEVLPMTYVRLLGQLLGAVSVPFKGEPLKGLQIMGPLETRALDFSNIIIMSANEGIFPRRSVSSSFIPPELRKGFGLPTYEYQDAVWAYYFYRMISRAGKVWLLTDSRTEGLKSGEESRYIRQLEYHFGLKVNRYVVKFSGMKSGELPVIEKTVEDLQKIRSTVLSATTLQNYLACPAKFYYSTIKKLKLEDEVAESLDFGMFGTIYHEVMRSIYSGEEAMKDDFFWNEEEQYGGLPVPPLTKVSDIYIKEWLQREDDVRKKVKALIIRELNAVDVSGRNLVVTDVIIRYVMKTLERDLELLRERGVGCFEVIGRELKVSGEFHGQRFKGFIDRLDSFAPGQVRVVDYKTGKVLEEDEDIDDFTAVAIADKIFAKDVKDRPKIALQFYIYDMLLKNRPEAKGKEIYNCVYSTSGLFNDAPKTVKMNETFFNEVSGRLEVLLDEMYDLQVPFRRTEDENVCKYCDFNRICSR